MKQQRNQRTGYVLIMTLVLISIAAMLLAGFARHSLLLAMESSRAQDDLQRRWGIVACRRAVLGQAEMIFDKRAVTPDGTEPAWPLPARISTTIRLGDMDFFIVLADEDAKANLNTVYQHPQGRHTITELIDQLSPPTSNLPLQLRPRRGDARQTAPAFSSWGQVFSLATPPADFSTARGLLRSTQQITCWGSGRLNLRRASDDAVQEIGRLVATAQFADKLLELRRQPGKQTLNGLLRGMAVPARQARDIRGLFSDESQTYSLWLEVTSNQRQSHALFVGSALKGAPGTAFVW